MGSRPKVLPLLCWHAHRAHGQISRHRLQKLPSGHTPRIKTRPRKNIIVSTYWFMPPLPKSKNFMVGFKRRMIIYQHTRVKSRTSQAPLLTVGIGGRILWVALQLLFHTALILQQLFGNCHQAMGVWQQQSGNQQQTCANQQQVSKIAQQPNVLPKTYVLHSGSGLFIFSLAALHDLIPNLQELIASLQEVLGSLQDLPAGIQKVIASLQESTAPAHELPPPPPCKPPPLAISPPHPGDRHFHVFLVNMYCAGLCCPSALHLLSNTPRACHAN